MKMRTMLSAKVLARALGESEYKKLLAKYDSAKQTGWRPVTDRERSLMYEFRKSNLLAGEFCRRKQLARSVFDTMYNRVAREEFMKSK